MRGAVLPRIMEKGVPVPNSISNIQWLDLSEWREIRDSGSSGPMW